MTVEIQTGTGTNTIQLQTTGTSVVVSQPAATTVTVQAAGIAGPQGAIGVTGASGSQGPSGSIGPSGSQGPSGSIGPSGSQGPSGSIGPSGSQGPAGAIPNTGSFAVTGSNIFTGNQTITGNINLNGNQTITGSLIHGLEGNIATGEQSHAEGSITKAIGNYSHAEGDFTEAKGDYSHAEGQNTIASGSYSHAEGNWTIALGNHQHVQGQYNAVSSVPYAFIVGNGTDSDNRSNLIHAAGNQVQITGSLNVNGSITGSLFGTSSWATNAITASYVSSNFQYEVHVSQVDGNDTTGNGDLLKPVATIGKALLIVSASVASTDRRTIIVHPGTYIENITVNTTNTYFFSTGLLGANCLISGSVTVSAATRMSGLKMTNLIVSSSAPVYINNCAVDKQMTVSGSGYLEVQNTSLQCTSGIQVVGPASSGVIFENCSLYPLTVNNASAAVYIISCNQAITPTLTAGALTITRSTISSLTSGATSTALTTAAGSVLVLESCNVYNSLLTSHAAITANGFYSIKNIIYNRSASTLASLSGTGGPLATVTQFQYINADNIVSTNGLTVTGSLNITGSTTQTGNINLTGSLNVNGSITGSLFGTASYATTASYFNTSNLATTGSVTFTGNQIVTGSTRGNVTALSIASNTASMDLSVGNFFTLQLVSGSNTYINPSNILPGQTSILTLSTTGSATVSWPSSVKQPSGSAYVPTATAGIDIITLASVNTSSLYVVSIKNMI